MFFFLVLVWFAATVMWAMSGDVDRAYMCFGIMSVFLVGCDLREEIRGRK